ncbi:PAS domain-containing protein [Seinonella peptonophila]|uniref:histidine kinase n=1 Tax=Seinonella peptonophila TaxID=112248 RepID=A0A1M4XAT9_9BACL|nr:ATP-binding protein [Seinonella peptonophila]SHE90521.1 PAS domain-containing protein [Seinonella peptonophila]
MSIAYRIDKLIEESSFLNEVPGASVVIDKTGVILSSNGPFQRLLQLNRKQIIGKQLTQFVLFPNELLSQQDDGLHCQGQLVSQKVSPIPVNIEMKVKMERGKSYYVFSFHPEYYFQSVLRQAFASLPIGIVFVSTERMIFDLNETACSLLELDRREILYSTIRQDWCSVFPPVHQSIEQHEVIHKTAAGERDLLVTTKQLVNEQKESRGALYLLEDITDIRSLERQILYYNRLATIGQIAAGSAHEIRNPLTSVKGFLQMFQQQLHEGGHTQHDLYIELMLKEINRISRLVGEFLCLSKPRQIERKPLDLFQLIPELAPIIRSEAILHNIELVIEPLTKPVPLVLADAELLKQVLLNLSKNAIEAMGHGGELRISLDHQKEQKQLFIHLIDTGPGISAHFMKQIFKPFFTTKEKGTGLGLSICKQIMKELKGEILVDSNQHGSTFSISLPVVMGD